jgi:hypothetical protein
MIVATATFAVLKQQAPSGSTLAITILIDLDDIRLPDGTAFLLPTYGEAVRIATQRGLAGETRLGLLRRFGVNEFATVHQRIVFSTAEELDSLVAAMA